MMVGWVGLGLGVLLLALGIVLHWPWYARLVVALPALAAGSGFFQATRNTCIMRANEGTFENDDFSTRPAEADEVAASRKVAAGIRRDMILVGIAAAALAAASAWIS